MKNKKQKKYKNKNKQLCFKKRHHDIMLPIYTDIQNDKDINELYDLYELGIQHGININDTDINPFLSISKTDLIRRKKYIEKLLKRKEFKEKKYHFYLINYNTNVQRNI